MIILEKIVKRYMDAKIEQTVLRNLNLTIEQGQSISIQGASGSGKSTLLHLLAALDKPDSGEIVLHNGTHQQDITQFSEKQADRYRQSYIGIIFQKFNLIDCISVLENVCLPAKLNQAKGSKIDQAHINTLLSTLGIEHLSRKYPKQLSGGEQQRVAIARALSHKPSLLLADEPTGNLDNKNAERVSELLISTCNEYNASLIFVTHSEKLAQLTQRHYMLNDGTLSDCSQ